MRRCDRSPLDIRVGDWLDIGTIKILPFEVDVDSTNLDSPTQDSDQLHVAGRS
jgi:hypothetical protein